MPSSAPVAVLDTLNSLLEAEMNSVFRFMGEGSPYLGRAGAEVRQPLNEMVQASHQNARELAELIESYGGHPIPRGLHPEDQYLAYLSLKFLLPKLVTEKKLMIERYENALSAIDQAGEVQQLINRHLETHRSQLKILEKTTEDLLASSKKSA
jgi:hypothetical protein